MIVLTISLQYRQPQKRKEEYEVMVISAVLSCFNEEENSQSFTSRVAAAPVKVRIVEVNWSELWAWQYLLFSNSAVVYFGQQR